MPSMSAHPHDDHPWEFVFGVCEGDHFRFEVQGQICPNADADWRRSQLHVTIHVCTGNSRDECSLVMFSDDFHRFKTALKRLVAGEKDVASLETGDYLAVDLRSDGTSCNVSL